MLPTANSNWPIVHSFELSDSEEQVISLEWLKGDAGKSKLSVERTGFDTQTVELEDSEFLEEPESWLGQPLDVQQTSVYQPDASFNVWEIKASKKIWTVEEFGEIEGFRLWIEIVP